MGEEGGLCQRDEALSFPKVNDTFSIKKATTSEERGGVGWGDWIWSGCTPGSYSWCLWTLHLWLQPILHKKLHLHWACTFPHYFLTMWYNSHLHTMFFVVGVMNHWWLKEHRDGKRLCVETPPFCRRVWECQQWWKYVLEPVLPQREQVVMRSSLSSGRAVSETAALEQDVKHRGDANARTKVGWEI